MADKVITIGSKIILLVNGEEKIFEIVEPTAADLPNGKISYLSPLGKAIAGKAESDQGEILLGNGIRLSYQVVKITDSGS